MFLLKKIAGEWVSPLSVIVAILAFGLVLVWFTRRQRLGKLLSTAGFLLFVLVAYGALGGPALRALEGDYTPLASPPADIKWIVVLGGGATSDPDLPPAQRASQATLARAVEGVRLYRLLPGAKLVVSGAAVLAGGADADTMAAIAQELGVPRDAVVRDTVSPDTETQARTMRALTKGERCIVVTSAAHMRRSLALFRKAGVDALPAPTHFLSQRNASLSLGDFFPKTGHIHGADVAAHEYLGLAWARLTGRI
ncbi:MAG TPA: ElyC/SanA/YdcF family protein [Burkholderiales bacterium]|nr:ElyC/SanA/YdcF family protein [Burkholderiales bacterium]